MTAPFAAPPPFEKIRKKRTPVRSVHAHFSEKLGTADRIAMWITNRVGTIGFFAIIATWTVFWLGWNLLAPVDLRFDPPMGFVLWLFISNLIQILLMPLIMVGQNIQGRHAEARAEHDLEVNVRAEEEIELILQHLEYQNAILLQMVAHLNIPFDPAAPQKPALTDKE